ncbi:hypothetical protein VST7929_02180 [Vibrio stylophorae]|uniref:DUF2850 domain-containing protein n=1 Tax=Vibrio stylophorae TaxID=659351 RepID=A0ABN8DT55_9VIBR|nr:DUF2850 domain-containing protein [Vibrio stylophorae]CAH0534264.1 hypothetical protein VST7929_02180 [Vibrio stylophorae]
MDQTKRYTLIGVVLLVLMVSAGVGYSLLKQHGYFAPPDVHTLYGEWVEQEVPAYSADRIEINDNGIFHRGKRVATAFAFDGEYLRYEFAGVPYQYRIENDASMVRLGDDYYQPMFVRTIHPQVKNEADVD